MCLQHQKLISHHADPEPLTKLPSFRADLIGQIQFSVLRTSVNVLWTSSLPFAFARSRIRLYQRNQGESREAVYGVSRSDLPYLGPITQPAAPMLGRLGKCVSGSKRAL